MKTRMFVKGFKSIGIVDAGACEGADILIAKRKDAAAPVTHQTPETVKAAAAKLGVPWPGLIKSADDAVAATFAQLDGTQEAREEMNKLTNTLWDSLYSIFCDATADKPAMIGQTVAEFAAGVQARIPEWFPMTAKAGAKMAGARKEKLKAAMAALQEILTEVEGMMADATAKGGKDLEARLTALETKATDAEKRATDAEAENATLKAKVAELEAAAANPAATETAKADDAQWEGVPATVRKRLEDTEKRLQDSEKRTADEIEKRENTEYVTKAKERYPHLGLKSAIWGPILRVVEKSKVFTTEQVAEFERVMKTADGMAQQLCTEIGRVGDPEGGPSAWDQIEAAAKELVAQDTKLTIHKARDIVMQQQPQLVARYHAERGAAH